MQSKRNKNTIAAFIAAELDARMTRNSNYSLRAFARDIDLPPSTLSRILSKKREPSAKMALAILEQLDLSLDDAEDYRSVVLGHRRQKKKLKRGHSAPQKLLTAEEFSKICSWHSLALLELITIPGIDGTADWIAKALKTTKKNVVEIVKNLEELGFVRREGNRIVGSNTNVFYKAASSSDPLVMRHFREIVAHMQTIPKNPNTKINFVAESLAVRKQDLPKIVAMLKPFADRVRRECSHMDSTDSLYQMLLSVFPVYTPE